MIRDAQQPQCRIRPRRWLDELGLGLRNDGGGWEGDKMCWDPKGKENEIGPRETRAVVSFYLVDPPAGFKGGKFRPGPEKTTFFEQNRGGSTAGQVAREALLDLPQLRNWLGSAGRGNSNLPFGPTAPGGGGK